MSHQEHHSEFAVTIVCGSREFTDTYKLIEVLDREAADADLIVHGDAAGADRMAGVWAAERGIPVDSHPADWNKHGRAAGYIRNVEMLERFPDARVIAFHVGSTPGTKMMIQEARARGHHGLVVRYTQPSVPRT